MKQKTIGILQPGYLPWLGFFEQIQRVDLFIILDDVQYTKGSWRNRHRVRTKDGWRWLTVPVYQKGRSGQLIRDAEIDNTKRWAARHWNCLCENYHHSKYWPHYSPFFKDLYQKKWRYLVDLDMEIILFCVGSLGITTEIAVSNVLGLGEKVQKQYGNSGDVNDKNIFLVKELRGTKFYEGALGRHYLDEGRFSRAGIELFFQEYEHPVYKQRFEPFIPYLSIVDLLFNHGPDSMGILLGEMQV